MATPSKKQKIVEGGGGGGWGVATVAEIPVTWL